MARAGAARARWRRRKVGGGRYLGGSAPRSTAPSSAPVTLAPSLLNICCPTFLLLHLALAAPAHAVAAPPPRSRPPARAALAPARPRRARAAPPLLRRPRPRPRRVAPSLLLRRPSPRPRRAAPPPLLPRSSPHRAAVPSRRCRWLAAALRRHALHRRPRLSLALVSTGGLGLAPPCPPPPPASPRLSAVHRRRASLARRAGLAARSTGHPAPAARHLCRRPRHRGPRSSP